MRSAKLRLLVLAGKTLPLLGSLLTGRRRSFREDSIKAVALFHSEVRVLNPVSPDESRGKVLIVNHYTRPGLGAWWIALALSATFPADIHWIMTSAWAYPDRLRSMTVTPVSRWILQRLAKVYGFTSMPPMPPRAHEIAARVSSIRSLLQTIDRTPGVSIGLAPEGADSGVGTLARPPAGVGRLLQLLLERGLQAIPVGIYEQGSSLTVRYGPKLPCPGALPVGRSERDAALTNWAMRAIANCLPPSLRGPYA